MHGNGTGTIAEHSPQTKWARDLIPGHSSTNNYGLEPAIRVSTTEAAAITAAELLTPVPASARSALAIKIQILRRHTNAPNSALRRLIQLNKEKHWYDYLPLHRMESSR
jgi:hypothetical protein